MFIRVRLLNGLPEPLWYAVPTEYAQPLTGLVVQVPVRNRIVPALVIDEYAKKPSNRKNYLRSVRHRRTIALPPATLKPAAPSRSRI